MDDEAGSEHKQNHEQFGPGEPVATHLHLEVLETKQLFTGLGSREYCFKTRISKQRWATENNPKNKTINRLLK